MTSHVKFWFCEFSSKNQTFWDIDESHAISKQVPRVESRWAIRTIRVENELFQVQHDSVPLFLIEILNKIRFQLDG